MMNTYTVESVLYNTPYRSRRGFGTIQEAVRRDDVWVENGTAYAVRVRPHFMGTIVEADFWATIAIVDGE